MLLASRCIYQNKTTFLSNNFLRSLSRCLHITSASLVNMPAHKLIANTKEPPLGELLIVMKLKAYLNEHLIHCQDKSNLISPCIILFRTTVFWITHNYT